MRFFFTITLLLLAVESLLAQEEVIIPLGTMKILIPDRQFYVDSVIDARIDKENVGTVRIHGTEKNLPARFNDPLEVALMNCLKSITAPTKDMQPIIIVIDEFELSDDLAMSRGTASLEFTICHVDSGRLVSLGTFRNSISGGTSLRAYAKHTIIAIENIVLEFNLSKWKKRLGKSQSPVILSRVRTILDSDHDILKNNVKRVGVYDTFNQLRTNSPRESAIHPIFYAKDSLYIIAENTKDDWISKSVGVSDGIDIFINSKLYNSLRGSRFVKVIEVGRYTLWYDYYLSENQITSIKAMRIPRFVVPHLPAGAAPVAAALAVAALINQSGRYKIDLICLDMVTGDIQPIKVKTMEGILADDPELLENYKKSKFKHLHNYMQSYIMTYNRAHPLN